LPFDTDRLATLLGEAGLVRVPDGVLVGEDRQHVTAQLG
jgi:hypothetical protein